MVAGSSDPTVVESITGADSGKHLKLTSNAINDQVTLSVPIDEAGTYAIYVKARRSTSSGKFQLAVEGVNQGAEQNEYDAVGGGVEYSLGSLTFATTGTKSFKFTVTGKDAASSGYGLSIDAIRLAQE